MADVILLLGGNEDGTRWALGQVYELLKQLPGEITASSGIYTSPPWGFSHPHWFLNQVVWLKTSYSPENLLAQTQRMEKDLGRKAKTKPGGYEARLIDIDILFFDDRIIEQPALTVPHPRLHLRRFTLLPLHELMPDWMHPVLKKTVRQLLRECPDDSDVRRIDQSFAP